MSDYIVNDCPKGGTHVFPTNPERYGTTCLKCGTGRLVTAGPSIGRNGRIATNDFVAGVPKMGDYEIVVEMPMSGKRAYGAFFTSRATEDDILRIRRGDRDLVRLHPDRRIEVADGLDRIEESS